MTRGGRRETSVPRMAGTSASGVVAQPLAPDRLGLPLFKLDPHHWRIGRRRSSDNIFPAIAATFGCLVRTHQPQMLV